MTNSQLKAAIAGTATIIFSIGSAVLPQIKELPPDYKFYGTIVSIIIAVAGAVVTAMNQSLSAAHVSVPEEAAKDITKIPAKQAAELGLAWLKSAVEKQVVKK
jgi:hypothetical protein